MEPSNKYIIDQLLPTGEVHLIAGASGSGKTTWLMQMLRNWSQGEPVLDYVSFPCKWAYIACDRSLNSVRATMERVGVSFPGVYVDSMVDNENLTTMDDVCERVAYKDLDFLVLEGIGSVVPGGKINDYDVVANFLRGLTRWCANKTIDWQAEDSEDGYKYGRRRTILATTHSPKMKEKEHYVLGRDKIIGSTAWGAFADTIITIENVLTKQAGLEGKDIRQVSVMPRNAKNFAVQYVLDDMGAFEPYTATEGETTQFFLDMFLMELKDGAVFAREGIEEYLKERHAEVDGRALDRMLDRWLGKLIKSDVVERIKKGTYRKVGFSGLDNELD